MECSIKGCPGRYEKQLILHTFKKGLEVVVLENVPAEVCSVCGDTLLSPKTIKHIDRVMMRSSKPEKFVPVYEYA